LRIGCFAAHNRVNRAAHGRRGIDGATGMERARAEAKVHPPIFALRPLSPALGVEIIGVDLSEEIDDYSFTQIQDAWHRNLIILLRGQELSEEDQVRFAEKFGPPAVIHTKQFVRNHPAVMLISNIREDGKPIGALPDGEMHFHTDQCHQERREFVYEHAWRPGDLLMWDNCCTLHARTDFSASERRLMRRVTILGEKSV
jgi:alpha-ketoglutarate-dependent taurine dioxygenase